MKERDGSVRTMVVTEATAKTLGPIMTGIIDLENSRLMTDAHPAYKLIRHKLPHNVVKHELTYVDRDTHIQGIEGYWAILKRGLVGTFHHVDAQYLPNYLNEFEYRFNRRKVGDEARFASLVGQVQGRVQWFCRSPQPQNPHA